MGVIQALSLLGLVAVGRTGARYDAERHVLEATAGRAADLRAPSATSHGGAQNGWHGRRPRGCWSRD